jgi:hypothetical protein
MGRVQEEEVELAEPLKSDHSLLVSMNTQHPYCYWT